MVIIFVMLILIVLFALWLLYDFSHLLLVAFVNGSLGAVVILRGAHDLYWSSRKKQNAIYYLLSGIISLGIYFILGNALQSFLVIDVVAILLISFVLAQIMIGLSQNHAKIAKNSKNTKNASGIQKAAIEKQKLYLFSSLAEVY